MVDIASFTKSLKTAWIKKYLDDSNRGKWKDFFELELRKYGGKLVLTCNLNKVDTSKLILSALTIYEYNPLSISALFPPFSTIITLTFLVKNPIAQTLPIPSQRILLTTTKRTELYTRSSSLSKAPFLLKAKRNGTTALNLMFC